MATYTLMHEIMASPTQPLPEASRRHHCTRMEMALHNLISAPQPTYDDWKVLSTAVNMIETLIEMGVLADPDKLHADAMHAMATAGKRHADHDVPIRLDGLGIQAMRGLVADYEEAVTALPARTMIRAYRLTEQKVEKLFGRHTKKRAIQR